MASRASSPRISAVFCNAACILRDSGIDPSLDHEQWTLVPATLEAVRSLASEARLLVLVDPSPQGLGGDSVGALDTITTQVRGAGGRIDAAISCSQADTLIWGDTPWALWLASETFSLDMGRCYLLAEDNKDVRAAFAAGVRPIVVLGKRKMSQVLGKRPENKGFPAAPDLTSALGYLAVEDEMTNQLGTTRESEQPQLPDCGVPPEARSGDVLRLTSSKARDLKTRLGRSKAQLKDLTRWLAFFVLGAAGLSLGIAYLLTHLYRVQPFPDFVYYLTLQFIPRIWRGVLFVCWGLGIIVLALRSYFHTAGFGNKKTRRR